MSYGVEGLKDKSVHKFLFIVGKMTLKLILEKGVKNVHCIQMVQNMAKKTVP
jgi:hypothetical protein